jgi:hypothetical protein
LSFIIIWDILDEATRKRVPWDSFGGQKVNFRSLIGLAGLLLFGGSALSASTFSFSGTLTSDDGQAAFDIVLNSVETITLSTNSFASGGFPTVLSLFGPAVNSDPPLIAFSDQSEADAMLVVAALGVGTYTVVVTEWDNTPTGGGTNLLDPDLWVDPPGTGNFTANPFNPGPFVNPNDVLENYTGNWAVEFQGVDGATQLGTPEPATWLSLLGGLGILVGVRRSRRLIQVGLGSEPGPSRRTL